MSNEHDRHFSNWIVNVIIISITVLSFYYHENYHHLYTYINFNFHLNYRIICIHFSLKQFSQLIFFRLEACYSKKWQERERSILNSWNYYFQVGSTGQEFDLNLVLQIDRRVNSCSFLCSFTVLKKMLQIYHSNSFVIVSNLK